MFSDRCIDGRHIRCHEETCRCGCHRADQPVRRVTPKKPTPTRRDHLPQRVRPLVGGKPGPKPVTSTPPLALVPAQHARLAEIMREHGATETEIRLRLVGA